MPDAGRAAREMRRVTRTGGVLAAAVWDFRGGVVHQRLFWDTAAALDRMALGRAIACSRIRWPSPTGWPRFGERSGSGTSTMAR
jgi:hypothetical protein